MRWRLISMGCSTSAVVPVDSDIDDSCPVKVRVNPSTPDQINVKDNGKIVERKKIELLLNARPEKISKPPLAFEVPAFDKEENSLIKKYPPKRLRRFEDQQSDSGNGDLSHEAIDERQKEAEIRRKEILTQRIMSAKKGNSRRVLDPVNFPSHERGDNWEKNM